MTSPADFQLSEALALASPGSYASESLPELEPELVFTQDRAGQYLSFYWRDAADYGIKPEQVAGSWMSDTFGPIAITPYLSRIRQVLDCLTPESFSYPFRCAEHSLLFDLVVSPVAVPGRNPTVVLVMGKVRSESTDYQEPQLPGMTVPANPERYQRLLTLIAWNIRRTLDLDTIWQQTVKGLGKALDADRCIICSYKQDSAALNVVAEYCSATNHPMLGLTLKLADHPHLNQALAVFKPILVDLHQTDSDTDIDLSDVNVVLNHPGDNGLCNSAQVLANQQQSMLVVATCYQDQPNGLLCLYQNHHSYVWSEAEIELVQELADQVGTAIAHATLFSESQALAHELQRVNASLMQKHKELEEAHQQAEEASRLKSEFLANTSHELRTPLNGMIGFLKLVMDGMADDPEEQNEFIEEAYRSALHLLNVINDILDIAKIEAGKMQLELSPVKLDELLSDVEDFTATQAYQKNLSFQILTPATHDEIILYGNYQRLLQVMLNLVGNAIKFTHEGGITISAEVIKKKANLHNQEFPGMVKVRVADTGIGVSLDKQDKLFQSFSQVDGSRTRQYGGTGLGLTISQKLVEAMGGVVNFYSMGEGLGSTVTFTVPLYQEPLMVVAQSDSLDLLL